MILRYLHMNLHQMKNMVIFMTKSWFSEKVSATVINLTRNIKR